MAIAPPSDILLDVANAADPARLRAATEQLGKLAADPAAGNEAFSKALSVARAEGSARIAPPASPASPVKTRGSSTDAAPSETAVPANAHSAVKTIAGAHETYQKFEAVLLQTFVESMLPKDEELFGDKTSAGAYRSMMAEQFATQLAKAGGIGIAAAVEHAHPEKGHGEGTHRPHAGGSISKVPS